MHGPWLQLFTLTLPLKDIGTASALFGHFKTLGRSQRGIGKRPNRTQIAYLLYAQLTVFLAISEFDPFKATTTTDFVPPGLL